MSQEKIIFIFTSKRTSELAKFLLSLSLAAVVCKFGTERTRQIVPSFYTLSSVTPSSDEDLLGTKMWHAVVKIFHNKNSYFSRLVTIAVQ